MASMKLARVVEEQVCLVEEEDELRLVEVALLRQVLEQVGEQPHEERREQLGPVLDLRQLEARDDPLAVGGGAQEVARVELRLAEEGVGALVREGDEVAQDDARRRRGQAAGALKVRLALVGGQVVMTARRSLRSSSARPFLSA